jgi:hypothetical protein
VAVRGGIWYLIAFMPGVIDGHCSELCLGRPSPNGASHAAAIAMISSNHETNRKTSSQAVHRLNTQQQYHSQAVVEQRKRKCDASIILRMWDIESVAEHPEPKNLPVSTYTLLNTCDSY